MRTAPCICSVVHTTQQSPHMWRSATRCCQLSIRLWILRPAQHDALAKIDFLRSIDYYTQPPMLFCSAREARDYNLLFGWIHKSRPFLVLNVWTPEWPTDIAYNFLRHNSLNWQCQFGTTDWEKIMHILHRVGACLQYSATNAQPDRLQRSAVNFLKQCGRPARPTKKLNSAVL